MSQTNPIKRALLSVSDKTGIIPIASFLEKHDVEILSTGGTAALLKKEGIRVKDVSEATGHPEIMDGRVKTLHPKIHGGILGRRDLDMEVMREHQIDTIDLVIVNLYPFAKTLANPDASFAEIVENIDIGGPTMVRAAAKNHQDVTIVVDPKDYQTLIDELHSNSLEVSKLSRFQYAVKAFEHTAQYDGMIANYLSAINTEDMSASGQANSSPELDKFPRSFNVQFQKIQDLRYGENSHQKAAFYADARCKEASISSSTQHQGKDLSFNNIADADAALECVKEFDAPACVIVKHANPCGVAIGETILDAYDKAYKTDPNSAFGGIIAFNRRLDKTVVETIIQRQFVEVIIAPEISQEALTACQAKPNVRLLSCGVLQSIQNDEFGNFPTKK